MKKKWKWMFLLIPVMAYFISSYWLQFMLVLGDSMNPTYKNGELVFIQKISKEYMKNDVVALFVPELDKVLIKRIAATPGSTVWIRDGILYVDGAASAQYSHIDNPGIAEREITLQADEFFLLGDNLDQSIDSRFSEVGIVKAENIIGLIIPNR